ncbi:OadG family protein [Porphyromonas catoniae]|uniref:OadG family protein n=1 Tax=Porphyromonas catoniae TaxID=41976 RepID=UPI0023F16887|nr:OadG family transporter subunit [Porphyromonas catoniae]
MNTARLLTLSAGLALTGVTTGTVWAQNRTTELPEKVLRLQEQDPAGLIMTFTAVLVVFAALVMLVLVFRLLGQFFESSKNPKKASTTTAVPASVSPSSSQPSGEALVAISLALQQSLGGQPSEVAAAISLALRCELEQHDAESYVLTIRHRPTQWNAHIQGTQRRYK